MKRYLFDRISVKLLLILFLIFFSLSVRPAFSDTVSYEYDNQGRLNKIVSSGGAVIVYEYDAAGRVISTTRKSTDRQLPVLAGITPNNTLVSSHVDITIQGSNLLTTKTVSTNVQGIQILHFSSTENSISISAEIESTAPTGPAVFTVETLTGTASISTNLVRLTQTPMRVFLTTGTSANITATIEGLTTDYNLVLTNDNTASVSAPASVLVPASGVATFTVAALSQGSAFISAGNSGVTVFVSDPLIGSVTAASKAVSVGVEQYLNNGAFISRPVSVWPGFIWGTVDSNPPVSVKIAPQQ